MIFKTIPNKFNSKFTIVSSFIIVNDKFLLLKRSENESLPKTWGLPAGKVKQNEQIIDATVREVNEETGQKFNNYDIKYWGKVYVKYPNYDCIFHMSKIELDKIPIITLAPKEHSDYKWVTIKEALEMNLIPDMDKCIYEFFKT
jgi:8-oxo-dGTP diphosphatase